MGCACRLHHASRITHHASLSPFASPNPFAFIPAMPSASLSLMVRWCDQTLRTEAITDYDGAHNGLQVENHGTVHGIAAAVDASVSTATLARAARADLLVVHHGLFWGARHPWTGRNYELLRLLLENNL